MNYIVWGLPALFRSIRTFLTRKGENESNSSNGLYYMAIALLSERRSKDPDRQVGACIVNEEEDRVVGIGYNGMPLKCRDEVMPWKEKNKKKEKLKLPYVCHAEMNAVVNMDPKSVAGCTAYVTLIPCRECAKILIQSGIKKVVYLSYQDKHEKSKKLLEEKMECRLAKLDCTDTVSYPKLVEIYNRGDAPEPTESPDSAPMNKTILNLLFGGSCPNEWRSEFKNYKSGDKFELRKIHDPNTPQQEKEELQEKKKEYRIVSWEQYFMAMAIITRDLKSVKKTPGTNDKEGACIVNDDKRIVGLGCINSEIGLDAPITAVVNTTPVSVRNCTMYVTSFPCNECAKVIVQSGIKCVIYLDPPQQNGSRRLLDQGGIGCAAKNKPVDNDEHPVNVTYRIFDLAGITCIPYQTCYEMNPLLLDFAASP